MREHPFWFKRWIRSADLTAVGRMRCRTWTFAIIATVAIIAFLVIAIICTGNEIAMGEAAEFWQQSGRNQIQNARYWTLFYQIGIRRLSGKGYGINYDIRLFPPDKL